MRFIPNTADQITNMLEQIGVESFADLIESVPETVRLNRRLEVPGALSEIRLEEHFRVIAEKNADFAGMKCLLGGGVYRHHVPAAVRALLSREEFWTSYTPYQPEMSQGTLQSMFEAQTYFSRLSGLDVVVPSMYDGATATAEAALMALRVTHRPRIIIGGLLHPYYSDTVNTYLAPHSTEVILLEHVEGLASSTRLEEIMDASVAAVIVQSPNFFGAIEDLRRIGEATRAAGSLLIVVVAEALSLGVLQGPGVMGADLVACDTNSFGVDLAFGGPHNAFLASRREYVRQLPGRVVGETQDLEGRRAFVMTLRAREQDIRREKATSNICSNHGLNVTAANVYLSLLGTRGLHELALLNTKAAHYLETRLLDSGRFYKIFDYPFFNEFILGARDGADGVAERLLSEAFVPPLKVSRMIDDQRCHDALLFCATELLSRSDLDRAVEVLSR